MRVGEGLAFSVLFANGQILVFFMLPKHPRAFMTQTRQPWLRPLELICNCLLGGFIAWYLVQYLSQCDPYFFNPDFQTDDARTIWFPFHRYTQPPHLLNDPIAGEMLALVPPFLRFLFGQLASWTDVYVAPKIVQGLALSILGVAAFRLVPNRRFGLASGLFLLFIFLHTYMVMNRIAGGLPRAFAFPFFALWASGVISRSRKVRWISVLGAGLTYPSAMAMLLGAEGSFVFLRELLRRKENRIRGLVKPLGAYAGLVGLCVLISAPMLAHSEAGKIHTLEEAKKEPGFYRYGRLGVLPFPDPVSSFGKAFLHPLQSSLKKPTGLLNKKYKDAKYWGQGLLAGLFLMLVLFRLTPLPLGALSFFVSSAVLYTLSRLVAFSLYSPERYYSFGMRACMLVFLVETLCRAGYRHPRAVRPLIRGGLTLLFVGVIWLCTGPGIHVKNGITISRAPKAPLYEKVMTMDDEVLIAAHPFDADDIPYWTGRATMGGYETLQPWFKKAWAKQKSRTQDTFDALYASDPQVVLDYAKKHRVTHFLINKHRYGNKYKRNARTFEPFSRYAKKVIGRKKPKDFVFHRVPQEAVIFRYKRFSMVSVDRLARAWAKPKQNALQPGELSAPPKD